MADFSVDITSDGGLTTFDPDPLKVPPGSLVSWNNKTGSEQQIEAPAQGVPGTGGGVAAFETTVTFPGLSTTPEYWIPSTAPAGTSYPYSAKAGGNGTIVVVAVQDLPEI